MEEKGFGGGDQRPICVFPNNRIGHLGLLKSEGFICYRGEELTPRLFRSSSIIGRLARRLYYYLVEFSQPIVYQPEIEAGSGLVNLPSSRWMFGLNRYLAYFLDTFRFHKFRMQGIVKAVHSAAQQIKWFIFGLTL